MTMVAETDFVESATEVAVTVTLAGLGTVPGAEYWVAVPLVVEVAERLPHCGLPHATDHLIPPFALSLLTTAVRLDIEPVLTEEGAAGLNATEID